MAPASFQPFQLKVARADEEEDQAPEFYDLGNVMFFF
jgi:hypothetical protein